MPRILSPCRLSTSITETVACASLLSISPISSDQTNFEPSADAVACNRVGSGTDVSKSDWPRAGELSVAAINPLRSKFMGDIDFVANGYSGPEVIVRQL